MPKGKPTKIKVQRFTVSQILTETRAEDTGTTHDPHPYARISLLTVDKVAMNLQPDIFAHF